MFNHFSIVSQTILLSSNTGPVMVEATVSDYKEVDLYAIGIYDEGLKVGLINLVPFYAL